MKKLLLVFLFLVLLSSVVLADAPFHIGLVTLTVSLGEEEYRGAEQFIKEYGLVSDGGIVEHLVFPDNLMAEIETSISQIFSLASDPLMKAIVASQAVPGTVDSKEITNE